MAIVILATVGLSSCKKDYTCTCTVSGVATPVEFAKAKKKDAEDACTALETTSKVVDPAASCTLKKK